MRVGILGSGLMGSKLGTIFARAGHDVVFSYARRKKKLEELAREAGGRARAGTPGEAAEQADALPPRGALVAIRRRAEADRRPGRQGHRHLLAADE